VINSYLWTWSNNACPLYIPRRFPGGESYSDLINRLESVVIDMEQQLGPTVVVSHVSVLQVLLSYFRATPVSECASVEIPLHTVLKFVPLRGGGWLESHHRLVPETAEPPPPPLSPQQKPTIWGDSSSCLPTRLSSVNLEDMEETANASTRSNISGVFVDE
jgi:Histidine phosphatase superfamily (branch 1)